MAKRNIIDWIALVLLVVGGLNWGLIGIFNFDLVSAIFGSMTFVSRLVYALVGLSAAYSLMMPSVLWKDDGHEVGGVMRQAGGTV